MRECFSRLQSQCLTHVREVVNPVDEVDVVQLVDLDLALAVDGDLEIGHFERVLAVCMIGGLE